jgi:hypothetical protein
MPYTFVHVLKAGEVRLRVDRGSRLCIRNSLESPFCKGRFRGVTKKRCRRRSPAEGLGVSPNSIILPPRLGDRGLNRLDEV